jgi:protein phosphatase
MDRLISLMNDSNINICCDNTQYYKAFGITDTGRRRENNEDAFLIRPEHRIYIVADGMGGHNAGEVASTEAVKVLDEYFTTEIIVRLDTDPSLVSHRMIEAFSLANNHIIEMAENPTYEGMGCALIMAFITDDTLHVCHIGDVRCYVANASGIQQLTNDHSEVGKLVREGTMTPEEARHSPLKNYLTQAIGHMSILDPEHSSYQLKKNDRVLLCTDGLWDMLTDLQIQEILSVDTDLENISKNLIADANVAGGFDNVTVVIVEAIH